MLRVVFSRNIVGVSYLCSGCSEEDVFKRWVAERQPPDGASRVLQVSGDLGNGSWAIDYFQKYLALFSA